MRFLSLFSGIGGLDLGLDRAGMTCVAQVEIDPFCRRVLAKHWPNVPRFEDVRTITRESIAGVFPIDLIAGGFPCQDISNAGKRAGITGERSGLWSEFFRLICQIRPRLVLVENVAALLSRGMGTVLGDLAAGGYDAEWDCIPAAAFDAEHFRDRLFIIAHLVREGLPNRREAGTGGEDAPRFFARSRFADGAQAPRLEHCSPSVWRRDFHGIPGRVDRIRALGNAVVPQVAEWIGRRIMEATV